MSPISHMPLLRSLGFDGNVIAINMTPLRGWAGTSTATAVYIYYPIILSNFISREDPGYKSCSRSALLLARMSRKRKLDLFLFKSRAVHRAERSTTAQWAIPPDCKVDIAKSG